MSKPTIQDTIAYMKSAKQALMKQEPIKIKKLNLMFQFLVQFMVVLVVTIQISYGVVANMMIAALNVDRD